jgi:hypothetical protein
MRLTTRLIFHKKEVPMDTKKIWVIPELTIYGDIETITQSGPPPKVFGGGDGAVYQNLNVTWGP